MRDCRPALLFESGEGGSGVPAVPTEFADEVCDAEVDGVLCAASIPAVRKTANSTAWIFMGGTLPVGLDGISRGDGCRSNDKFAKFQPSQGS
jgi:hypothetical protein